MMQQEAEKYIGWIPTIAGRLFFDNWRCSKFLSKGCSRRYLINYNQEHQGEFHRNVVIHSKVDWKDQEAGDGNFSVILITGNIIGTKESNGRIYIYPHAFTSLLSKIMVINNQGKEELRKIEKKIGDIDKVIKSNRKPKNVNSQQLLDEKKELDSLLNKVEENPPEEFNVVDFNVDRYGFTTLQFNEKSSSTSTPKEDRGIIVRQAFYYIKYSLHKHQHHEHGDDSVTSVIPIKEGVDLGGIMLENIMNSLVTLKRRYGGKNPNPLYNAQGIIAYARSLRVACEKSDKIIEPIEDDFCFFENLGESITTKADEINNKNAESLAKSASMLNMLIALVSILTIFTSLYKDSIVNKIEIIIGKAQDKCIDANNFCCFGFDFIQLCSSEFWMPLFFILSFLLVILIYFRKFNSRAFKFISMPARMIVKYKNPKKKFLFFMISIALFWLIYFLVSYVMVT